MSDSDIITSENEDTEIQISQNQVNLPNVENQAAMDAQQQNKPTDSTEQKLAEVIQTVGEMNTKMLTLTDAVNRLLLSQSNNNTSAKVTPADENTDASKNSNIQITQPSTIATHSDVHVDNTSTTENTTAPVYRAFDQPKLHCILPKSSFSGTIENDGITLIHFLKIFEEECRIRKVSNSIKPNLFIMQCVEPARSLIRSAAKQWNSWPLFRDEMIKMFCTEADKAYACRALSVIEHRNDEKYWTLMDRVRSLSYQAYSHEITFDKEGNLCVAESGEMNSRITDKFIQCIRDRTLKAVIIAELSREPGLHKDPDYIARFADQSTQYLKFSSPVNHTPNHSYRTRQDNPSSYVNYLQRFPRGRERNYTNRPPRAFYEDVEPSQKHFQNRPRNSYGKPRPNTYERHRTNYSQNCNIDGGCYSNPNSQSSYVNSNNFEIKRSNGKPQLQCYGCYGYGHYKNECPTMKRHTESEYNSSYKYSSQNQTEMRQPENPNQSTNTVNLENILYPEMKLEEVWKDIRRIEPIAEKTEVGNSGVVSSFHPDKGVFINTKLNGIDVRALTDTGSDISISSLKWLNKHLPEINLRHVNTKVSVASEQTLPVAGSFVAAITLPLNDKIYSHTILVTEKLNCDLILGTDFMRRYGCNVDLLRNVFTIEGQDLMLVSSNGKPLTNVKQIPSNKTILVKNTVIPPYSECVVLAKVKWDSEDVPNLDNRQFSINHNGNLQAEGLVVANCFVKHERDLVNILLVNKTCKPIEVKRGSCFGEVEEVEAFFHELAELDSNSISQLNRIVQSTSEVQFNSNHLTVKRPEDVKNDKIVDFESIDISPDNKKKLETVCADYHEVFSRNKWDFGECDIVPHKIQLKPDARPIQSLPRRVPYYLKENLKEELKNMLDAEMMFPTVNDNNKTSSINDYARNLERKLTKAVQFARNNLELNHNRYKLESDKHVQFQSLEVGDNVLIKDCVNQMWDHSGRVVETFKDNPVLYKVERNDGRKVMIHHNKLKKVCNRTLFPDKIINNSAKCRYRKQKQCTNPSVNTEENDCDYYSSDEDDNLIGYVKFPTPVLHEPNVCSDTDTTEIPQCDNDSNDDFLPNTFVNPQVEYVNQPVLRQSKRQRFVKRYDGFELYGDAVKCGQYNNN
ncbi:hypothetical protein SNE40_010107 [Patella caerulea]|uniref:CCHC-type domain-containing protein n=1 Tax=Patella caerulea TaxID=87958 RepID=A0AAN8JSN2_PATCE